ncbi:MAG: glycosyltransferase family 61 protein, partial [Spirochaetia bacterium]
LPDNLMHGDEALFRHELVRDIAETRALLLRDVSLLPNGFLVSGARVLRESFHNPDEVRIGVRRNAKAAWYLARTRKSCNVETALLVTDEFSNGFFHWVCDVLPRLEALNPAEAHSRTIVVPAMAALPYVKPSLEPYGFPETCLSGWNERIHCHDLMSITPAAPTGNYRPSLMHALRRRFRDYFGYGPPERRLYVSRARALRRKVANEEETFAVLCRHGFERVFMEEMTFAEQVRLVGSAKVLVGNHGAGLANIAWMSPGTTVLELRLRGDGLNNCYFSLASSQGVRYRYLACAVAGQHPDPHTADLLVDPAALDKEISSIE